MTIALTLAAQLPLAAHAADVVRLGNLKFAHYGAVAYMKEIAPKYNLKIEERIFAKGLDIVPAMIAGEIDVSASALEAAISGRASGVPVYLVGGFAKGGVRIVGRPDLNLSKISELKGKKVGVTRGSPQEILLFSELAKNKLTWSDKPGKDVLIIYMGYPDLNQALLTKEIDAMSQSEPYSTQAIHKKYGHEILKPYDTPLGEPVRALVMSEKMYKEKRDVAQRFMDCFVAATRQFLADPKLAENYVRVSMFKNQVTSEDYRDAMENASFTEDITISHVQLTTDYMVKYGVGRMSNPPAAKDWVKLDLLETAKKSYAPR
ncbi:putative solute-binding periplasmic protein of ABC transport [Janthinobacterium agaricidamnosum NBRC 102515 = DSM 9628]|uniref:Putative solute-binding periplasmic protein of ABC transport n=2 Tax=Janthinobacterium agaricidamnosum TaxID=55508 RepID=W0VAM8_9BURK|nr:putative solute-binding periplasmic protein of ABC transport [Janthinobacterium agaricidamnosum NBRC 102515 = DSM 9628]